MWKCWNRLELVIQKSIWSEIIKAKFYSKLNSRAMELRIYKFWNELHIYVCNLIQFLVDTLFFRSSIQLRLNSVRSGNIKIIITIPYWPYFLLVSNHGKHSLAKLHSIRSAHCTWNEFNSVTMTHTHNYSYIFCFIFRFYLYILKFSSQIPMKQKRKL